MRRGLFDRYLAVDWSAGSVPKLGSDSIWIGVARSSEDHVAAINVPTRKLAELLLGRLVSESMASRERVLVGFDFPFGYPAGFAGAIGLGHREAWKRLWRYLDGAVEDGADNVSNRFEVAAQINRRLGRDAPFWGSVGRAVHDGLPATKAVSYRRRVDGGFEEWRETERALLTWGKRPQPAFKLAYAGSVGSQSLLGIPVVHRLRHDARFEASSAVWPFEVSVPEPASGPSIVHVEVWPSMFDFADEQGACRDERQVRAVVRHWRLLDEAGRLAALFDAPPEDSAVREEEGWVLGAPQARARPVAHPARDGAPTPWSLGMP